MNKKCRISNEYPGDFLPLVIRSSLLDIRYPISQEAGSKACKKFRRLIQLPMQITYSCRFSPSLSATRV